MHTKIKQAPVFLPAARLLLFIETVLHPNRSYKAFNHSVIKQILSEWPMCLVKLWETPRPSSHLPLRLIGFPWVLVKLWEAPRPSHLSRNSAPHFPTTKLAVPFHEYFRTSASEKRLLIKVTLDEMLICVWSPLLLTCNIKLKGRGVSLKLEAISTPSLSLIRILHY